MIEKYLVINAGSSSLKFSLYDMPSGKEIVNGLIEKIGKQDSVYTLKFEGKKVEKEKVIMNHSEAVNTMLEELLANKFISDINEIKGIGHRVLHGGEIYSESALITDVVLRDIRSLTKLGPLHHPGQIAGIEAMFEYLPDVPQVAVFDTAFHQTMPEDNYIYPVPREWYYDDGVRKYGFHGTSHKYLTEKMQERYNKNDVNLIICHIGSGASISCIKDGKSYNTTMGLTPLEGLMMGTRSGSIDPSIIEYICKVKHISVADVTKILNKRSGLLGICGKNDLRDIEALVAKGDKNAKLAMEMLKNSIVKYIAQYYFELDGEVDAIIFTAGVGENCIPVRKAVVDAISKPMGVKLDNDANNNISRYKEFQSGIITTSDSKFEILVMPTNEEYMILKDTYEISKKTMNNGYRKVKKPNNK